MERIVRRIDLAHAPPDEAGQLLRREWLVTNGLGGYASATISGAVTWRYHGLLIAALPAPFGRTVMLNHLAETVRLPDGTLVHLSREEQTRPDDRLLPTSHLTEFRLENQLPIWRYEENLGHWHVSRMQQKYPTPKPLSLASWKVVPPALQTKLAEHYME